MNPTNPLWSARPGVRLEDASAFAGLAIGAAMTVGIVMAVQAGSAYLAPVFGLVGSGTAWAVARLLSRNHRRFYPKEA